MQLYGYSYEKSGIFPGVQKVGWLSVPWILFLPDKTFHFIQQSNGIEQIVKCMNRNPRTKLLLCLNLSPLFPQASTLQNLANCLKFLQFWNVLWLFNGHSIRWFWWQGCVRTEGHRGKNPRNSESGITERCSTRADVWKQEQGSHALRYL